MSRGSLVDPPRLALAWPQNGRSIALAALVGAALNPIDQGDALFVGAPVDWREIALT